ncbi:uncharacterized protein LOC129015174 [Pongo pygmaeus]|uniref:uncharacterized protein LOC129015174 n=1 Tax=Pongo pygmaeus TaxID=9600 RepID=UPI0023E234ED|nr:uncharacterized protein LOC129015174 [Pongo pygmaeus]
MWSGCDSSSIPEAKKAVSRAHKVRLLSLGWGVRTRLDKNYLVRNSYLFRPPWGARTGRVGPGARAQVWGRSGGGERASPRPLRQRRGASSSASLAEGALGSSGVPLLSAAAAPPAPLGGDEDQRRRRADWERPPSSQAAGEARRAAGCCLRPPEPVQGWGSGGGWRKRARGKPVGLRRLPCPAPPSLRPSQARPALRTSYSCPPPSKAGSVPARSQLRARELRLEGLSLLSGFW